MWREQKHCCQSFLQCQVPSILCSINHQTWLRLSSAEGKQQNNPPNPATVLPASVYKHRRWDSMLRWTESWHLLICKSQCPLTFMPVVFKVVSCGLEYWQSVGLCRFVSQMVREVFHIWEQIWLMMTKKTPEKIKLLSKLYWIFRFCCKI